MSKKKKKNKNKKNIPAIVFSFTVCIPEKRKDSNE